MAISGPLREARTSSDAPLAADESRPEIRPSDGAQGDLSLEVSFVALGLLVLLAAITLRAQTATEPNQLSSDSQHGLRSEWSTPASANTGAPIAPKFSLGVHSEFHSGAQVNDSTSRFIGWKDETPILRQEYSIDDGTVHTLFYAIKRDGALSRFRPSVSQPAGKHARPKDPPGLTQGRVLALENPEQTSKSEIKLAVNTDAQKLEELHQAIQDWQDGKRDADKGFPQVPAMLKIQLTLDKEKPVFVWEHSTILSASGGEAGYSYSAPHLSFAVLSPTGKTLFVELTMGEALEYRLITMPEKSESAPQHKTGDSHDCRNLGAANITVDEVKLG
jgi:hypothetical protein